MSYTQTIIQENNMKIERDLWGNTSETFISGTYSTWQ